MTSTGDFRYEVNGINKKVSPIEDIDLNEVDRHLDRQASKAQERYDAFYMDYGKE